MQRLFLTRLKNTSDPVETRGVTYETLFVCMYVFRAWSTLLLLLLLLHPVVSLMKGAVVITVKMKYV